MYICITLLMCTPIRCSWRANLIYKILTYREKEGMMLASVDDEHPKTPKFIHVQ